MSVYFFKQKTAYELRISDWISDVCASDLGEDRILGGADVLFDATERLPAEIGDHDAPYAPVGGVDVALDQPCLDERVDDVRHDGPVDSEMTGEPALRGRRVVSDDREDLIPAHTVRDRKSTRLNSSH